MFSLCLKIARQETLNLSLKSLIIYNVKKRADKKYLRLEQKCLDIFKTIIFVSDRELSFASPT